MCGYYVKWLYMFSCSYSVEDDQVTCFIRIPMDKVEKIVIGKC